MTQGNRAQVSRPENAYLRIGTTGKLVSGLSGNDGTPPDFSWVDSDGELARGYEVSASLAPGSYTIRSHVLIPEDSADGYAPVDNISRADPARDRLRAAHPDPDRHAGRRARRRRRSSIHPDPHPDGDAGRDPHSTATPTPTVPPDPTPTPTPDGSVAPTEGPTATPTPDGSVAPATGHAGHDPAADRWPAQ